MTNKEARDLKLALSIIERTLPDEKFPVIVIDQLSRLQKLGLISVFGCTDGNYVEITDAGLAALLKVYSIGSIPEEWLKV